MVQKQSKNCVQSLKMVNQQAKNGLMVCLKTIGSFAFAKH